MLLLEMEFEGGRTMVVCSEMEEARGFFLGGIGWVMGSVMGVVMGVEQRWRSRWICVVTWCEIQVPFHFVLWRDCHLVVSIP